MRIVWSAVVLMFVLAGPARAQITHLLRLTVRRALPGVRGGGE